MGGRPERKQMLEEVSTIVSIQLHHLLFIKHVRNPEDALALFYLGIVEVEVGAFFVQTNAVGQSHCRRNEEIRRLRVGCAQQEQSLEKVSRISSQGECFGSQCPEELAH